MFKTHESSRHDLQAVFGPGHHHWRLIERDIATPWLHATRTIIESNVEYAQVIMPSDLQTFLSITSAKNSGERLSEPQLMSPPWMNKAGRWLLEPISQIEIAETSDNGLVHIYRMEGGGIYYDPPQTQTELAKLSNTRIVYRANIS